jgi:tetratricopeptide (TPR) repeat protein
MAKRGTRKADSAGVAERLERAAEAYDAEDFAAVLAHADALLAEHPEHPEALHFRAAAQVELGEVEEAARSYMRAVKGALDDLELLLSAAECLIVGLGEDRDAVVEGLAWCARGRKLAERAGDVELVYEFLLLEATGRNQVGECEASLASAEAALAHVPR